MELGSPAAGWQLSIQHSCQQSGEQSGGWMAEAFRQPTDDVTERGFGEGRELTKKFPAPGIG